ncbi:uncharacterized protein LOC119306077 [Triticum dicoccoides]|uniref:uncharacterized protein LOC119306077 n=1 Tax=Triticum dicoccoides TaxID=85692 RepID=UPI00188E3282|nr:uncharacterized protein LOC119306077 [Triticum dicoccoides]
MLPPADNRKPPPQLMPLLPCRRPPLVVHGLLIILTLANWNFVVLHLWHEIDMLAFCGSTHGYGIEEYSELRIMVYYIAISASPFPVKTLWLVPCARNLLCQTFWDFGTNDMEMPLDFYSKVYIVVGNSTIHLDYACSSPLKKFFNGTITEPIDVKCARRCLTP